MSFFGNKGSGSGVKVVNSLPTTGRDREVVIDYSSGVPVLKVFNGVSNTWQTQASLASVGAATDVAINNTGTNLTATTTQAAIVELDNKISTLASNGGILTFQSLTDLQTAYPNGTNSPVWVVADQSWYYWNTTATPDTTPPTVTVSPIGGTYTSAQTVTLTSEAGATIYYSVDGSNPTVVYSSPITINSTKTLKYYAKDTANNNSVVESQIYTINIPDTTAPNDITNLAYNGLTQTGVTLTWTNSTSTDVVNYQIYQDGVNIGQSASSQFIISGLTQGTIYNFTVKAKDGANNMSTGVSISVTTSSTVDTTAPIVTVSPVAGVYTGTQSVTLTANEIATIYYTTDGTTPTQASTVYSTPISISATTTLQYFAKDTAGNTSLVEAATYTINAASSYVTTGLNVYYNYKNPSYTSATTTVNDESGNGHIGTLYGFAGTVASGFNNGELVSDGTSDYIEFTHNTNLKVYPFTIEFYMRMKPPTNTFSNDVQLFDIQYTTGSGGGVNAKFHRTDNTNTTTQLLIGGTSALPPSQGYTFPSNVFDNVYRHYVIVFGSNYQKIYVDGSLVFSNTPGSANNSYSLTSNTRVFRLYDQGTDSNGAQTINGAHKLFRFYNKELSQAEITQNYNDAIK